MAWLSGYGYRKQITINGSTAGAQTNYQIKLTVHKGSGSDSAGHVYLNNHCQDDFDDIRFTKSDGSTELDHWQESYVSATSAVFWIEFDSIPASPDDTNFYIYYDNSGASSGSDGDDTFLIYDHFLGSSLDTGKWAWYHGGNRNYEVANSSLRIYSGSQWGWGCVVSQALKQAKNTALEALVRLAASYDLDVRLQDAHESPTDWVSTVMSRYNNTLRVKDTDGETTTSKTFDTGTWYRTILFSKTNNIKAQSNGTNISRSTTRLEDNMYVALFNTNSLNVYFDFAFLRKYCDPEPTWGDWGSEESSGAEAKSSSDTGSGAESSIYSALYSRSETGSGAESLASRLFSVVEAGSGIGASSLLAVLIGTEETGLGSEFASKIFSAIDSGSGIDTVIARLLVATEIGSALEAALLITLLISGDEGLGSDLSGLPNAFLSDDEGSGFDALRALIEIPATGSDMRLPTSPGRVTIPSKEVNL